MPPFLLAPLPWDAAFRQLLLAPCVEEILFRLGLQDLLAGSRADTVRRRAAGLTAIAFGAAHVLAQVAAALPGPPPPLPALSLALATTLPAWWIGRGYRRHRSLPRCIAWHAAFNACWLLLLAPAVLPLLSSP
ncbi:CPBP family glutamic-type intramembrane protease [Roseateles aquatilis]|nr:CPBP family glutamic-type intramembrane protease [Roseateles aquatilis]